MPPARFPDFRWFFRTVRVLPLVAVATLAGGIIGGFSVFAIDLALTAPLNHDIRADGGNIANESAAAAAPTVTPSAPPTPAQAASNVGPQTSVPAQQPTPQTQVQTSPRIAVTPPQPTQQTSWPDALSREHKVAPGAAVPVTPRLALPQPAAVTPAQAPVTQAARDHDVAHPGSHPRPKLRASSPR